LSVSPDPQSRRDALSGGIVTLDIGICLKDHLDEYYDNYLYQSVPDAGCHPALNLGRPL